MFGPTHPVTRLDRVLQQLRSFADLHAAELEALATELEAAVPDPAARLRAFQAMQRDESLLVIGELTDIRGELAASVSEPEPQEFAGGDPAVNSPKRAKWLAEQAARDEQLRRPRSRRQLLGGAPYPPSSAPPSTMPEA